MKRKMFIVSLLVMVAILLSTFSVMANSQISPAAKKTPGAQATANAIRKTVLPGKMQVFIGVIQNISADELSLTLKDDTVISFTITADTRIKVPTLGKEAGLSDLAVDQKAGVHARADDAGNLTALSVMVIPGKPDIKHHVGTITAYTPGASITIADKDGETFTFLLTAETKIQPVERASSLAVGVRVTIISPRDVAEGAWTAKGIVIHPDLERTKEPKGTKPPDADETPEATELPAL